MLLFLLSRTFLVIKGNQGEKGEREGRSLVSQRARSQRAPGLRRPRRCPAASPPATCWVSQRGNESSGPGAARARGGGPRGRPESHRGGRASPGPGAGSAPAAPGPPCAPRRAAPGPALGGVPAPGPPPRVRSSNFGRERASAMGAGPGPGPAVRCPCSALPAPPAFGLRAPPGASVDKILRIK